MIEPKMTSRPAKFGTRGAWQAEADHMRAHPGDTFIIERRPHPNKAAYALAAHVRRGGYVAFRPAGAFDAWVEREGANLEVIAVYVGNGGTTPEPGETVASEPAPVSAPDSGSEADDEVDLYALSEDELRSHLESLATPELYKIMESMGMSPFFANRIDAIGVIETKVHYAKAAEASTPAPDPAKAVADDGLEKLTRRQLIEIMRESGLSFVHNDNKQFLIDSIRAHRRGDPQPPGYYQTTSASSFVLPYPANLAAAQQRRAAKDSGSETDTPAEDPKPARRSRTVAVRGADAPVDPVAL